MAKIKVAADWLAACAGCEMSLLDMDERLVQLLDKIELTSTPITDLKHPPKEGVTVGILSGTVNNTTNVEVVKEMRERCKVLIALGDCAVFGGIMTMRNFFDMNDALKRAYVETESTVEGIIPRSEELGKPIEARPVNQVVKVDVHLPGCPPSADAIHQCFFAGGWMNSRMKIKRIGILTAGGDCPGLNAVIRAIVKTAIYRYGLEVIGFQDGYSGVILGKARILESRDASGILHRGGTILGTSNRDDPFHFPAVVRGKKIFKDVSARAVKNLQQNKIDILFVLGGDGSLTIANKLSKKGVRIVGVPKTIDNDLWGTDVTFGFDTALQVAMGAIDRLHSTAEAHHRIMVVEVMGRYAGWIALEAGLAGGGDVILIPEIPYDIEKVCEQIRERHRFGKRFSIVVVAEGAKPKKGEVVVQRVIEDSTDPLRLGGIGYRVGNEIEKRTGLETRVTVLGHVQRGGSPSAFDRILATRFGTRAVELAMEGRFGRMVCLRGAEIKDCPLDTVGGRQRNVPPHGDLVRTARSIGVSFGD